MSDATLRIAPRSNVAVADLHLLRVARTELVQPDRGARSLADRLRRRIAPDAPRRS